MQKAHKQVENVPRLEYNLKCIFLCKMEGAVKKGLMWFIPQDAQKPIDPRKLRKMNEN